LVVCPATLVQNWAKEFKKWLGDERVRVFPVESKTNVQDFLVGKIYSVMVIGYEKLRTIQDLLKTGGFDIIVCDEGHRLKSPKIKTSLAIKSLPTRKRIILSGTPIQNDLSEYFAMVDFVNPGILGSYATFKTVFEEPIIKSRQPNATREEKELGSKRSEELTRLTSQFVLRRTAEVNNKYLPPKVETVVFCKPSSLQLSLYSSLISSNFFRNTYSNSTSTLSAQNVLVCITYLKKLCNSPSLLFSRLSAPPNSSHLIMCYVFSGKLDALYRLTQTVLTTTSEKIVLVSNYTQTLDILEEMCEILKASYFRLDGSTPTAKRQQYVDYFNKESHPNRVFLLSSKSGGCGLNLIGASRIVLFDIDWNPSVDLQAMARVWRDGQRHQVHIYRFLTTGTIEEKIFQRQLSKQSLSAQVLGDWGASTEASTQFTKEELKRIFQLNIDTNCWVHECLGCECEDGGDESVKEIGMRKKDVSDPILQGTPSLKSSSRFTRC
ncbi:P-loop containing nucleoside triphosphate hydrolase protein, partial [Paraphysoderma sedebokerense]